MVNLIREDDALLKITYANKTVKKTGISRDLIIHPGETIADVLEDRGISQQELAISTGVSPAYVSNVISGKKDISAKFAFALEYALGVPKSFWLNLQANYDAELLQANEENTITDEERKALESLKDIVKYLRAKHKMPIGENKDDSILSLRKALRISDISHLKDIVPAGAFLMPPIGEIDTYVLGAWIRMCQITGENKKVTGVYSNDKVHELVCEIRGIIRDTDADVKKQLTEIFTKYGIDFSVFKNFRGAPVLGYVAPKNDGSYQMVVTKRGSYADVFWFSVFHELGHIVNGDCSKNTKFVDDGSNKEKELLADKFARECLVDQQDYQVFVDGENYSIECIERFANYQNVMPYIVIGMLQKDKHLGCREYSDYRLKYNWTD